MKNFSKLIIPFVVLALSSCTTTNIAVLGSYNYNESSRYVELTENYDFSSKMGGWAMLYIGTGTQKKTL